MEHRWGYPSRGGGGLAARERGALRRGRRGKDHGVQREWDVLFRSWFAKVALCALTVVVAACAVTTAGRPMAADTRGPLAPIQPSALDGLLLSVDDINAMMNATSLVRQSSRDAMLASDARADLNCLAALDPATEAGYAGTDWTAVRSQALSEPAGRKREHFVVQSAVSFASAEKADKFVAISTGRWSACQNRPFTAVDPSRQVSWQLGEVVSTGDTAFMRRTQGDNGLWACLHGLKVSNNVSVDVETCGYSAASTGAVSAMLDKITAKVTG